ncbi:MAG: hypothetical protein HXS53_13295 [Theionarchaea archaeon]|nr:hypothetical protein [Theionarchaea archaeon]
MEEEMTYDIEEFLRKARERPVEPKEEPTDLATQKNFAKFSNLEEHTDYYQQVRVCKAILNDIRKKSLFVSKMERYTPGIGNLSIEDIIKIRYNAEDESYIIYAHEGEYDIYEGDIRFIYPSIGDIPDSYEYEVVYDDSSVYVYNKFTADPPFKVFGIATQSDNSPEIAQE